MDSWEDVRRQAGEERSPVGPSLPPPPGQRCPLGAESFQPPPTGSAHRVQVQVVQCGAGSVPGGPSATRRPLLSGHQPAGPPCGRRLSQEDRCPWLLGPRAGRQCLPYAPGRCRGLGEGQAPPGAGQVSGGGEAWAAGCAPRGPYLLVDFHLLENQRGRKGGLPSAGHSPIWAKARSLELPARLPSGRRDQVLELSPR